MLGLLVMATAACTKGGSLTASSTSSVTGLVTVSKVFPSSSGDTWTPIVVSNRFYIKGLALSVTGTCSRGMVTIRASDTSGTYAETATCLDDGTWTFAKTYVSGSGEGDKTVTFQAYDSAGLLVTGANTSVDVRIDNTAPSAVTITTPGVSPYSVPANATTFTISGTCTCVADGVANITVGGTNVNLSGNSWSYVADVSTDSASYTFYVWDIAGNQSAGVTQVFAKDQIMKLSGAIPGRHVVDAGGHNTIDASFDAVPGSKSDPFTNYQLLTGINYILKEEGH